MRASSVRCVCVCMRMVIFVAMKTLWIKASAKCINVNVKCNVNVHMCGKSQTSAELDNDPFISTRCDGGGKHLKHAGQGAPGTRIGKGCCRVKD